MVEASTSGGLGHGPAWHGTRRLAGYRASEAACLAEEVEGAAQRRRARQQDGAACQLGSSDHRLCVQRVGGFAGGAQRVALCGTEWGSSERGASTGTRSGHELRRRTHGDSLEHRQSYHSTRPWPALTIHNHDLPALAGHAVLWVAARRSHTGADAALLLPAAPLARVTRQPLLHFKRGDDHARQRALQHGWRVGAASVAQRTAAVPSC